MQVLQLKKMREAYNFQHRYTSTMTDKIRKKWGKKSRKSHCRIFYEFICRCYLVASVSENDQCSGVEEGNWSWGGHRLIVIAQEQLADLLSSLDSRGGGILVPSSFIIGMRYKMRQWCALEQSDISERSGWLSWVFIRLDNLISILLLCRPHF